MKIEDMDSIEDSMEELKNLRIDDMEDQELQPDDDYMDELDEGDDDDDEDEDDEEEEVLATLGFVEKLKNNWSNLRQVFPCKAGGIPAWLDPENLPSGKTCLCDICGEPLQFVLQIYAPISGQLSSFHRTIFVFMCPSMTCLLRDQHEQWKHGPEKPSRSVKVFRCQLPRSNAFYSHDPPKYDGSDLPLGTGAPLCAWCRTWKGDKICSSCKSVRYCSEKHQVKHWREGHKLECQNFRVQPPDASNADRGACSNETTKVPCKTLWPEYTIVCDEEKEASTSDVEDLSNLLVTTQQRDGIAESTLQTFEGDDDRKSWAAFQERLSRDPEQILRYSRDDKAQPLWPTSSGRPSRADIRACSYCGGKMNFEFQIMPQLLYYFGVKNEIDSLDWATIVVYTCADYCDGTAAYKEDLAWVQLNSQTT